MKAVKQRLLPGFPGDHGRAFVERTMVGGSREFKVFIPRECFPKSPRESSQPSMPVCAETPERRKSLGISSEELATASYRSDRERFPVLGFRFELDRMSPAEKFTYLKATFHDRFIDATLPASDYVSRDHYPARAHAVLTDGFRPWRYGEHETRAHFAYRQLLWYLDCRLKGGRRTPPVCNPRETHHREDLSELPNRSSSLTREWENIRGSLRS